MNHKEITLHIRKRLAASGVKARCKMQEYCGEKVISINVPKYDYSFTQEEQTQIFLIVTVNKLTFSQGLPVINNGTLTKGGKFIFLET